VTRLPARVRPRFGNPPPIYILAAARSLASATCSEASSRILIWPCTYNHRGVQAVSRAIGCVTGARLTSHAPRENLPIVSFVCLMVSHHGSEPPLLSSDYHHQVRLQRAGTTTNRTCGTSAEQGMPDGMLCILGDLTGQVCRCRYPFRTAMRAICCGVFSNDESGDV
jgi:hypothetical protein